MLLQISQYRYLWIKVKYTNTVHYTVYILFRVMRLLFYQIFTVREYIQLFLRCSWKASCHCMVLLLLYNHCWFRIFRVIKGTVQRDFQPTVFFITQTTKLVWATDQQVKIFSIFDKNSPSSTNFKFENMTPRGMIPRQVNLPGGISFFDIKVRISQRNLN